MKNGGHPLRSIPGVERMDFCFLCFVLFSSKLIAVILFILPLTDDLKQTQRHFKRDPSVDTSREPFPS